LAEVPADEKTRHRWLSDFPDNILPEHVDPPFDRDRLLPQAYDEPRDDERSN